jgi:hypothetical protein
LIHRLGPQRNSIENSILEIKIQLSPFSMLWLSLCRVKILLWFTF